MPSNEHIPRHVGVFLVTLLSLSVHTLDPPTCDHTLYGGMSTPENMDRPFKISVSDNEYGVNNNELYLEIIAESDPSIVGFHIWVENTAGLHVGYLQADAPAREVFCFEESDDVYSLGLINTDSLSARDMDFTWTYYGPVKDEDEEVRINATVLDNEGKLWTHVLSESVISVVTGIDGIAPNDCSIFEDPYYCVRDLEEEFGRSFNDAVQIFCPYQASIHSCTMALQRRIENTPCQEITGEVANTIEGQCPRDDDDHVADHASSGDGTSPYPTPGVVNAQSVGCSGSGCNGVTPYPDVGDACTRFVSNCLAVKGLDAPRDVDPASYKCRYYIEKDECIIKIPLYLDCDYNSQIIRERALYVQRRLHGTYNCAARLDCSSSTINSCNLGDMSQYEDIDTYDDTSCNAYHDALQCIDGLSDSCRRSWLRDETFTDIKSHLVSDCDNLQQQLSGGCDEQFRQCTGAIIYDYLLNIANGVNAMGDGYCRYISTVYECLESLSDDCPTSVYSVADALPAQGDPQIRTIVTCTISMGAAQCRTDLNRCMGSAANEFNSADVTIKCKAYYKTLDCIHQLSDDSPTCFDGWWDDVITLRTRNTLTHICPTSHDDCTTEAMSCMDGVDALNVDISSLNSTDNHNFCQVAPDVYHCITKQPHCTLNHNVYQGPEDPEILKALIINVCGSDVLITGSATNLQTTYSLLFVLCLSVWIYIY